MAQAEFTGVGYRVVEDKIKQALPLMLHKNERATLVGCGNCT